MIVPKAIEKTVPFQYAKDVIDGNIITGGYIKKAVDRFYKMIEDAEAKGYRLNHNEGMKVIDFFPTFLQHTKGVFGGEAFHLSPYQQFTLYNLFAWQKLLPSGRWVRVFKTVYEKVGRKNGKTAGLSGLGLFCESFDGESAPEVYVGATKEAQAKILWEQAFQFVFKGTKLQTIGFTNRQREIRFERNMGVFRFLGGDSKTQDGLNPSVAIIDEYHAHPTDGVREVLESAMGARLQPIMYIITTAGFNNASVQVQYDNVCKEILDGEKEDDSTFIMIHELDEGDDWQDETVWIKANPNLGICLSMDYLRTEYKKAVNQPSKAVNFKTKHLNIQEDAEQAWIPIEIWDSNEIEKIPNEVFKDLGSFAGTDLSTTIDITAHVIVSNPDSEGVRYIKPWFFCPKDTIDRRSKEDRVPYRAWADAGYLIATPGNVVDYDVMRSTIEHENPKHYVEKTLMDQWNASEISNNLQKSGHKVEFMSQGIATMSFPTKQFEKLLYEGKLKHDGNPVMRWMLGGCVIWSDANENIKVLKNKSHKGTKKRVDGIVAAIMGLAGSVALDNNKKQSKYSNDSEEVWM